MQIEEMIIGQGLLLNSHVDTPISLRRKLKTIHKIVTLYNGKMKI